MQFLSQDPLSLVQYFPHAVFKDPVFVIYFYLNKNFMETKPKTVKKDSVNTNKIKTPQYRVFS